MPFLNGLLFEYWLLTFKTDDIFSVSCCLTVPFPKRQVRMHHYSASLLFTPFEHSAEQRMITISSKSRTLLAAHGKTGPYLDWLPRTWLEVGSVWSCFTFTGLLNSASRMRLTFQKWRPILSPRMTAGEESNFWVHCNAKGLWWSQHTGVKIKLQQNLGSQRRNKPIKSLTTAPGEKRTAQ